MTRMAGNRPCATAMGVATIIDVHSGLWSRSRERTGAEPPGGGSYVGAKVQYGTFLSGNYLVFCIVHVLSDDTSWASTSGVHGCAARGSVQLSDCSRENNKGEENSYLLGS